jgi:molybdopterin-containing oxidoreductase family membrane subunit
MAYYFPPYFVAGAVFWICDGKYLLIIMRKVSNLEAYITIQHIELMNIVIMITGSIVGVAYIMSYLSLGILVLSMSNMLS